MTRWEQVDELRAMRDELRVLGRLSAAAAVEHAIVWAIQGDARHVERWLELAHQYNADEGGEA